jgi:hypothetical protein
MDGHGQAWSSGAATKQAFVRPATNAIPRRHYAPPYVIASGAKQSPLPHDPRLLRSARNDTARVFRTAAMLAQNAAIQRLANKDARIPCSKNKEMTDSSTDEHGRNGEGVWYFAGPSGSPGFGGIALARSGGLHWPAPSRL